MLSDQQFTMAVARAVETLEELDYPVNNRTLNIMVQDILPEFGVSRLRKVDPGWYHTLMLAIIDWEPSAEIAKRLKFQIYRQDRLWPTH